MKPSISLAGHRDQLRAILQGFGLANTRLFGSAARGDDHDASDLDILVDAAPTPRCTTSPPPKSHSKLCSTARST